MRREFKQIRYRNFIDFTLPSHWREDYSDSNQAAFFEDDDWAGTLRLSVMELVPPQDVDVPAVADLVKSMVKDASADLTSDSDKVVASHVVTVSEEGISLCLYRWLVARIINPKFVRLAIFTLTERTEDVSSNRANAEIALITNAVTHSVVSTSPIKLL